MKSPAITSIVEHRYVQANKKIKVPRQHPNKHVLVLATGAFVITLLVGVWQLALAMKSVHAAADPWTQTDWSGGDSEGTVVTSTVTTYDSATNIDVSTAGEIKLNNAEIAVLKGTQLSDDTTNFNVSSKIALKFNTSQSYNNNTFSYTGGSPTRLTVDVDGDYFVSVTLPLLSDSLVTTQRNAVELEVRVNGVKKDVGVGRSSHIRNTSQNEGSSHLGVLLEDLSANDYIEVFIVRTTTEATNTLTSAFTLYAERIASSETIFAATGTQTTSGTNLNTTVAPMQWDESIKDSGYTHSASSETVTIDTAGNYFVAVNIPLGGAVTRGNITGKVLLDGSVVDGGWFQQGYIRNSEGHVDSSIHWSGVVTTSSSNQNLTVTVEQEAAAGTITVDSEKATLFIQKLRADNNYIYHGEATQVGSSSNDWSPASKSTVLWATDNIIDTDTYTHTPGSSTITVDTAGDYLLSFNLAGIGGGARANPKITVQVNGSDVTGAEAKSHYIRNTSSHNSASDQLLVPLVGLSANDTITISVEEEGAAGTVNDATPTTLLLWKKTYPDSGTLTSNVFNAEFPANWDTVTYTTGGTGTVTFKARTDSSSDMSGAPDWSTCSNITSGSELSSDGCVTDTDQYIQYQVTLTPSAGSTPTFQDVSLDYESSDQTAPTSNASSVSFSNPAYLGNDDWTASEPTISWSAGADNIGGVGLLGYCVALDESSDSVPGSGDATSDVLDPETTGGLLTGIDDGVSFSYCDYIVTGTSLNLSSLSGLSFTTDKQYFFSIKAVDLGGNVYTGASNTYQDLISFKYDATAPTNVTYISAPSINFGSVDDMTFSWPSSGNSTSSDNNASGILGWQYQVNSTAGTWKGTDTHADYGFDYLPLDGSSYSHNLNDAEDGGDIIVGDNIVYFRSIDVAGNFSSSGTYRTASLAYGGDAPTFDIACDLSTGVTITPSTSTANSFALSWNAATANGGNSLDSYYYMINVSPPSSISTLTSNSSIYIPTTSTSVSAGALTGAVKGTNTVYVVATDDADNYSQSNCIKGTFTLNSTLPDPVQDLIATDSSIKSEEIWRATLTWTAPDYQGAGGLTYVIERSTNNSSWSEIGETTGFSYTDTVTTSTLYYYRVGVYDTTTESTNDPTYATSVDITPTGSYDEPPELTSEPVVTNITTKRATISWGTSRTSDSKVQYGTSSGDYFDEEPSNSTQVTDHELALSNLSPGTNYYFVAKWTDEDGNTGLSDEIEFTTDPAPVVSEVKATNVSITTATIEFTVEGASTAKLYYGETNTFGGVTEISTSTEQATYAVNLSGLADGTKYFYKINTFDSEGDEYEGTVLDFTTLERPRISNVQIQQVLGTAQPTVLVTWESNTEISSIVTYYPTDNLAKALDEVNVELQSGTHRMVVRGLVPTTSYTLIVSGRDFAGNEASSDPQTFTTSTDTRPPLISNLKIEGTTQKAAGGEQQAQLIISWDTDEAGTSQVEYGEGSGTVYSQKTQEDANETFNHLVVISGLSPSRVYHLRALSKDSAGNLTQSIDKTVITPKSTDLALDLVITNLREAFGFLGGL